MALFDPGHGFICQVGINSVRVSCSVPSVPPETRARSFGNYILQNWGTALRGWPPLRRHPLSRPEVTHIYLVPALSALHFRLKTLLARGSLSLPPWRIQSVNSFRFFFGKVFFFFFFLGRRWIYRENRGAIFFKGIFVLPKKYVEILKQRSVDNLIWKFRWFIIFRIFEAWRSRY